MATDGVPRQDLEVCGLWRGIHLDGRRAAVLRRQAVQERAKAVQDVQDICLVVPSHAFQSVLTTVKPMVSDIVRLVWGTKGLNPESGGFLHQLVYTIFSDKTPIAVLSGPSFAKEVALDFPTAVTLASKNVEFTTALIKRFHNDHFHLYTSTDLIGVQLAGVVKNVMAIAVGISDGMGFGANTRCALMTRGLEELANLCEALGGSRDTVMSFAGVGDLILTCTDDQSRNRRFGLALGKGLDRLRAEKDIGQAVEGLYNAKQVYALAKSQGVEMPITQQVYRILYENVSSRAAVEALLQRVPKTS